MTGKNTAVFGIYAHRAAAEEAVDHLRSAGFRSTDVSVLFPDNQGTKDFAHEKNTKAPEGSAAGVVAGGITGGVLGWLTGIGALAIPGLGPFLAAGPIVAALAGAGAVGALGGIIGALVGMGIPEYEARRFEGRIRGAQDIGSSVEKAGDFANAARPRPRVRSAGSGGIITPSDRVTDDQVLAGRPAPTTMAPTTTTVRRRTDIVERDVNEDPGDAD
jgi:hypothetical protein